MSSLSDDAQRTTDTNMTATDPLNICLIVLDSVRAANCSLYGARHKTTPYLSTLARESTVYRQARAPSNWSLPSHVSLFTGLETHVHGVTIHHKLTPGETVFDTLVEQHGYQTGLFTENGFIATDQAGISRSFQTVETVPEIVPTKYSTGENNPNPDGFYYADRFLDWIDSCDGPWAGCLNLMDAHRPFEPQSKYDKWGDAEARALQSKLDHRWEWAFHSDDQPLWKLHGLESLYDGAIRQADAIVESVVEKLRERDLLDETVVIICADHGDGFGEPGALANEPPAVSHIVPMSESLLHVPLIVRHPGRQRRRDIHAPAALTQFRTAAIEAATHAEVRPTAFIPDGPVIATKQPVTGDLRRRYQRAVADATPFLSPSRAVYMSGATENNSASISKKYHWGEKATQLRVYDAQSISIESQGVAEESVTQTDLHESIDQAFSKFEPASVRAERTGEVDLETKEHLEALGYF